MADTATPKEQYDQNKNQRAKGRGQNPADMKLLAQRVFGIVFFVAVVAGGAWIFYTKLGVGHFSPLTTCITAETYHVHAQLTVKINGETLPIPANIGSAPCVLPIHTHDGTGKIHVENAFQFDAKLGEFFQLWGKTFTPTQILDSVVDDTHELVMTVNGEQSTAWGDLILEDAQDIVIEYREKKQ